MSSAQRPLYPFAAGANAVQQSSPSSRQTQDANPYSRAAQPQPFQRPGLPRPSPSPLARPYGQTNAQAAPSSSTNLLAPNDNRSVQATFARPPSAPKRFDGNLSLNETPYHAASVLHGSAVSLAPSISEKFAFSPDPSTWGADITPGVREDDDFLHNPDPRRDRNLDRGGTVFTGRGLANVGCLVVLGTGLVALFAGYPLISFLTEKPLSRLGGFNIGGINATGQIPSMAGNWGLIDNDTPREFLTKKSYVDDTELELVFSDEFNQDGRTFFPGDDPYWEAVDLHYWATNNLEWYDPSTITTRNGALEITLSRKRNHDMNYMGGMMTTWNKFCFTGGLLEASVTLPGTDDVEGLWPAVWALGNLGRAGYGASLEGMWPYTYDTCDVGTVKNQTRDGLPLAATVNGDGSVGGALSFLPGQRLSRCTCAGESHPGPMHSDGTFVGRSAPEIDVIEAQVVGDPLSGSVSQSAQWAPFNAAYQWINSSSSYTLYNPTTFINSYKGGAFQQATSGVTPTNPDCYELTGGCFSLYGFEYRPGFDGGYITWISEGQRDWTLFSEGMDSDPLVEIGPRPIPQEPMYIIMNLGISENFGTVDFERLTFPTTMRIDYIRVYQRPDQKNIGCDPKDFPTQAYINQYIEAYTNPNLTTWVDDYKQPFPKNSYLGEC